MYHTYITAFWSPFFLDSSTYCADVLSVCLKKYGDIRCLVCPGGSDRRSLQILKIADLVVIGLPQNSGKIRHFLTGCRFRFPNFMLLILNYYPRSGISLSGISHDWRIPQQRIACIPYCRIFQGEEKPVHSARYESLCRTGWLSLPEHETAENALPTYKSGCTGSLCPSGLDFFLEIERCARQIAIALEQGSLSY